MRVSGSFLFDTAQPNQAQPMAEAGRPWPKPQPGPDGPSRNCFPAIQPSPNLAGRRREGKSSEFAASSAARRPRKAESESSEFAANLLENNFGCFRRPARVCTGPGSARPGWFCSGLGWAAGLGWDGWLGRWAGKCIPRICCKFAGKQWVGPGRARAGLGRAGLGWAGRLCQIRKILRLSWTP